MSDEVAAQIQAPPADAAGITPASKKVTYKPEAPASGSMMASGIHSPALRACIGFVRIFVAGVIAIVAFAIVAATMRLRSAWYRNRAAAYAEQEALAWDDARIKFAECLPPDLAAGVIRSRLSDGPGVAAVLRRPTRSFIAC